jgi:hypothetical protein
LLFESLFHGAAKNLSSVVLQDVVQPIDVVEPLPGPAMNDLREVEESRLSEFEQLLTLQIALAGNPNLPGTTAQKRRMDTTLPLEYSGHAPQP